MAKKGWHPDPGGEKGYFRYWDGASWSSELSPTPFAPAPASSTRPIFLTANTVAAQEQDRRTKGPSGKILLLLLAGILALALIVYLGIRAAGVDPFTGKPLVSGEAEQNVCPKQLLTAAPQKAHPADGRVHGGKLSFARQPKPWGPVQGDNRVPFGRDVHSQSRTVVQHYDKGNSWVSALLVAELYAGDGFYTPQEGSEIVMRCIQGRFYGDMKLTREDRASRPFTLGNYNGWYTEVHFGFDHHQLPFKGETAIVIIVATGTDSASLFYASIPDDQIDDMKTTRDVIADLRAE